MRNLVACIVAAAVLSVPAQAADLQYGGPELRAGAFVGGRLRLSLGGGRPEDLHAAAIVAPTQFRRFGNGRAVTSFGEGIALDFAGRNATLTLGGMPASTALHLRQQGSVDAGHRLGISTGAWIAVGAVVTVVAIVAVARFTCIGEDRNFCGSD